MDIHGALLQNSISKEWTIETRNIYQAFYRRMTSAGPLAIKIGNGGLSFYKQIQNSAVFVCHFNAKPQRSRNDLGFADFRFDALHPYLPVDNTIRLFRNTASQETTIKVHKLWCSLHFPLQVAETVADLFVQNIVTRMESPYATNP